MRIEALGLAVGQVGSTAGDRERRSCARQQLDRRVAQRHAKLQDLAIELDQAKQKAGGCSEFNVHSRF
jgi:hypothetical protein